ncbi:hypothetical protein BC829DRAFT_277671 [Chytridium lagenaria]|nr:hypothetical protein BC829DRAFT_277671 [Chytridium lagenaria]
MQQQQQQQRQGSQQRPRFQPPPPQTNVLNLTNVGGPGVPSGPLSPGGSAYPSQRFGGPVQGAMQKPSHLHLTLRRLLKTLPKIDHLSTTHYSIYSEYGAMESQADSSELASNANRDSRDLKDEARRMAEELFASTSFGTSAPGIDTGYQRGLLVKKVGCSPTPSWLKTRS